MRNALWQLSDSDSFRRLVMAVPASRELVKHYIAGEDLQSVLVAAGDLQGKGLRTSVHLLCLEPHDQADAERNTRGYVELLDGLRLTGLAGLSEISLEACDLGQLLGRDGPHLALANARTICVAARNAGCPVSLDMADHTTTDATLNLLAKLRGDYPDTGVAVQAMLRRTESDCRELATPGSRVRLCKGSYHEPERLVFRSNRDIDLSFVRCLRTLMHGPGYPMIASHDPAMIEITGELARRAGRQPDSFEYQMLYGVRPLEQRRLVDIGNSVRVYLPYGTDWCGFYMHRLAERPANLLFSCVL